MIAINPRRLMGASCLLLAACTSVSYAQDADDEVSGILQEGLEQTLGTREQTILQPQLEPPPPEQPPTQSPLDTPPTVPDAPRPSMKLDLADSLATAVKLNREFLSRREQPYGTSAGVTLSQPLLRGAGHDIAWEPLTQAERSLTYAIRNYEECRERFSIDIAREYYDLLTQQKTLANEDLNYANAVFDRRKAEALLQVGRNTDDQVFRARRTE